jgi:hypothetical protein
MLRFVVMGILLEIVSNAGGLAHGTQRAKPLREKSQPSNRENHDALRIGSAIFRRQRDK